MKNWITFKHFLLPEQIDDKRVFSLLEVSRSIQKTIAERYSSSFWVKAEINKLNLYRQSGHCYPELVEKQEGRIIAQQRGTLWRDDYRRVNQQFQEILKEPLKDGIKVLMLVKISFDAVHGMALQILDIDPAFTLGDLEREKQENLDRLKKEGLFNLNKLLDTPLLPKRVAIISVESSKGYADFMNVIEGNAWGYRFFTLLFPALLQGDRAAADITRQLNRIRKVASHFDVVAIIRGGGGDVGLSCYNNYELAKTICEFPLPVLTGIGHSTNETVSEMVSHINAITPTKLAEYLIQLFHNFSVPVGEAEKLLMEWSRRLLADENLALQRELRLFRSVTETSLLRSRQALKEQTVVLKSESRTVVKDQRQLLTQSLDRVKQQKPSLFRHWRGELANLEKTLEILRPENVLKRGYSITRINGEAVSDASAISPGTELDTVLYQGTVRSVVTSVSNSPQHE